MLILLTAFSKYAIISVALIRNQKYEKYIKYITKEVFKMKLSEVREILNAKVLTGEEFLDREVNSAFGSDLMSDVLAFVEENSLLLTGLINPQVIRTAEMMDIDTIVFVRGKEPDDAVVGMAKMKDIVLMCSDYSLYRSSGRLYEKGLGAVL